MTLALLIDDLRHRVRRRAQVAGPAALLLLAISATSAVAQTSDPAQLAKGRAIVERNCGMCHAVSRADVSRDRAAPPLRELHKRFDVDSLGEALAEGILTGHPAMPEFRFAPDEIVAIIGYLRSIQTEQNVRSGGPEASGGR